MTKSLQVLTLIRVTFSESLLLNDNELSGELPSGLYELRNLGKLRCVRMPDFRLSSR